MKLGIMQPYFFPYIGYFQLINEVDEFILFDTPQFIRHGWIERNQIQKINGEPLYIKVPLNKHSRNNAIKDVQIKEDEKWKDKILAQLMPYKKKSSNYHKVIELLKESWIEETNSIVKLNYNTLKAICTYLDINTPIKIWSEMNIDIEQVNAPDEWALSICNALGAESYYNPSGGLSFFDKEKYIKKNIELKFIKNKEVAYKQFSNDFLPNLSIIDIMMLVPQSEIKEMLKEFSIVE